MSITNQNAMNSVEYYLEDAPSPLLESEESDAIHQIASETILTDQEDSSRTLMIRCIKGTDSTDNLYRKADKAAIGILCPSNDGSDELLHVPRRGYQSTTNHQDESSALNVKVIAVEHIDGSRTVNTKTGSLLETLAHFFSGFLSDFRGI